MKTDFSFYYWINSRIYRRSSRGYITRDKAILILRQQFNIPKRMCHIIMRELEMLKLIKDDGEYLKVHKADEDKILKQFENKIIYSF